MIQSGPGCSGGWLPLPPRYPITPGGRCQPLLAKGRNRVANHRIAPTHPATATHGPLVPVRVDEREHLALALGVYHKGVNAVKGKNPTDAHGNLAALGADNTLERNHSQPLSRAFFFAGGGCETFAPSPLNLTEPFYHNRFFLQPLFFFFFDRAGDLSTFTPSTLPAHSIATRPACQAPSRFFLQGRSVRFPTQPPPRSIVSHRGGLCQGVIRKS